MSIIADDKDPHDNEALEYEFHRLMGLAEAFTGFDSLRVKLPKGDLQRAIDMLSLFVEQEREMRVAQLTPYRLDEMKKRIDQAVEKDDYYERLQPESKDDQTSH